LFETWDGEMCGSLVGLDSNDVAYVQQAATHVEITVDRITVCAEISHCSVRNRGYDVVNISFGDKNCYHCLKSKINKKSQKVSVHFVLKHVYFQNLHESLDRVNSRIIECLIPNFLQPHQNKHPVIHMPDLKVYLLDKEYQLTALKKLMACDCSVPFLLTGPFGTGKTKVLATAATQFLSKRSNRVLICTSHLQSADTYIDNYFGPHEKFLQQNNVNPVRLVGSKRYKYFGKYKHLFKTRSYDYWEIRQSRLIITTFLTAPQLISLKVKCFTHILIDEGAQTREPETIAPLGLADDNTKIVIAGDHLQVSILMHIEIFFVYLYRLGLKC